MPSPISKKPHAPQRAPRVLVPNQEKVRIAVGSEPRVIGTIHKLSATGGSVRLEKFFGEGLVAEITLRTVSGDVHSPIQFLRSGVDGITNAQAFRFVHMHPVDQKRLANVVSELRAQGFGDKKDPGLAFRNMARRALMALQLKVF